MKTGKIKSLSEDLFYYLVYEHLKTEIKWKLGCIFVIKGEDIK